MRILAILNKSFSQDVRAQKEISSLVEASHIVDVICFADPLLPNPTLGKGTVYCFPLCRTRRNRLTYALEYALYILYCLTLCITLGSRKHYGAMQIFLMPEALIICALAGKVMGSRVIVDWEDLGYELYLTKFRGSFDPCPLIIRGLEHVIVRCADLIIVPNNAFLSALGKRGVYAKTALVVMNAADDEIFFSACDETVRGNDFVLLYNGLVAARNGPDVAIRACALASAVHPAIKLRVVADGSELRRLVGGSADALFMNCIGRVNLSAMPKLIEDCDVGLLPFRNTPHNRLAIPTRIFEFGLLSKAVICADLPGIREYFDDSCVRFCRPGDPRHLADCIEDLYSNPRKRRDLGQRLHDRCKDLSWNRMKTLYCGAVEQLTSRAAEVGLTDSTD